MNTLTQFQEQCTSKTTSLKFQKAYVKVGGEAWLLGWIICSCRRRRRRGANPLAAASLSPPCRPATPSLPSRPAPSCFSPRAPQMLLGAPAPPQPTATPAPFVRPHRDCSWDLVEEMERGKEKGALAGGFHARGQGSTGSLPSSPSRHPYVQCAASGRWALGARASAVASRDDGTALLCQIVIN